jgi:hypothetical protein
MTCADDFDCAYSWLLIVRAASSASSASANRASPISIALGLAFRPIALRLAYIEVDPTFRHGLPGA